MVVEDRAVMTACVVVSSARATAGRLTIPAPTKAKVHALYFIFLHSPVCWFRPQPQPNRGSTALPGTICDADCTGHANRVETSQCLLNQPLRAADGEPREKRPRRFLCYMVKTRHRI